MSWKKKRTRRKSSAKAASSNRWLLTLLALLALSAGVAYFVRHELVSSHQKISGELVQIKTRLRDMTQTAEAPKPKFEFYHVLPKMQVDVDDETKTTTIDSKKLAEHLYVIQVASVRNRHDADRLKAQLLLMGYDAHVNQVRFHHQIFNRVNVGPYANAKRARTDVLALRKTNHGAVLRTIQ